MAAVYTTSLWQSLYSLRRGKLDGVVLEPFTYGRDLHSAGLVEMFNTRRDWLTGFGLDNNATVLVVGSAFGYLIEALAGAGITDVWGIDDSPHIWDPAQDSDWAPGAKAVTANDRVESPTAKASLNAVGAGGAAKFRYVVDEDAVPSLTDAEVPAFIAGCEARLQGNVKGRIVHVVTTLGPNGPGDSSQNWKTLAEWEAFAPDHTWVDARAVA